MSTPLLYDHTTFHELISPGTTYDGVTRRRFKFRIILRQGDPDLICHISRQVLANDEKWVDEPNSPQWERRFPTKLHEQHLRNFKRKFARDPEYRNEYRLVT